MNEDFQSYGSGRSGNMFYLRADREHSIVINGNLSGTFNPAQSAYSYTVDLLKFGYNDDGNYPLLDRKILLSKTDLTNRKFNIEIADTRIKLKTGESLAIAVSVIANGRSFLVWDNCGIEITEDSSFRTTTTKTYTAFEVGRQLVKIIDSEAEFESDILTEDFAALLMTSGESIRNVKRKDEDGIETQIPVLTTSFDDFFEAINTISPVAYDVVFREGKNIVTLNRIAPGFFNPEPIVKVGRVSNILHEVNNDWVYSSISIGYKQSGDIDGIYGLQATHTLNTYTLPIDRVENVYEAFTKYRCDPNEVETQRRKQYADFPEEDAKYDKDIFMFDSFKTVFGSSLLYNIRPNSQDFTIVKGVYSPESTYNNRLSPANCLLRHAPIFKSGLSRIAYQSKMVRYASSKGNPNLVTKAIGMLIETPEKLIREISLLAPAIFSEMKVTFEAGLEDGIYKAMKISDNRYRAFEYINNDGQIERGYIYKLDFGKSIKYELRQF